MRFMGEVRFKTVVELVVLRLFFVPNIKEETKIMQQPKLTLIFDGEPNINALPESEQKVFYTTLLERIFELHRAKEQGPAKK